MLPCLEQCYSDMIQRQCYQDMYVTRTMLPGPGKYYLVSGPMLAGPRLYYFVNKNVTWSRTILSGQDNSNWSRRMSFGTELCYVLGPVHFYLVQDKATWSMQYYLFKFKITQFRCILLLSYIPCH